MLTDLATLLDDPDLGSVPFTVLRAGTAPDTTPVSHLATGILQPGGLSSLDPQPGEDQSETSLTVFTRFPLSVGSDNGTLVIPADRIQYDNHLWRVTAVRDWSSEGFYTATATLLKDDPDA